MMQFRHYKTVICLIILCLPMTAIGQLTLEDAIENARTHAPINPLTQISKQTLNLQLKKLATHNRPQLTINGQATYQSDVTKINIDIPGMMLNPLSKDQYKITTTLNQNLYDGGQIALNKKIAHTAQMLEQNEVELALEKIQYQIIQLFFSVLEIDAQLKVIMTSRQSLSSSLKQLSASIEQGIALPSQQLELQAALLELDQQIIQLEASKKQAMQTMRLLTNADLSSDDTLVRPSSTTYAKQISADKYNLRRYDHQLQLTQQQFDLSQKTFNPTVGLFVQAGYGRPALNFLNNGFDPFYLVGIRMRWNFSHIYTKSLDKEISRINMQKISIKKETQLLTDQIELHKNQIEINKIKNIISQDNTLIRLRSQITKTAMAQLNNGTLSSADYIQIFNKEKNAREHLELHTIQLLKFQYIARHLSGLYMSDHKL